MTLCKYTAQTNVKKEQDIEQWLQDTTNWTGSGMVSHRIPHYG
jgi:hypothetical protein